MIQRLSGNARDESISQAWESIPSDLLFHKSL
jgi:hypothetical protein